MRFHRTAIAFLASVALCSPMALNAQVTMAGATAKCVDGTYSRARTKQGACSGHDGIARWFGPGGATATAAPANASGKCGDGTYTTAKNKQGACSTHGGVARWYEAGEGSGRGSVEAEPIRVPSAVNERDRDVVPARDSRGASALCNDGTYSQSQHRSGTCSYHGGVRRWLKQIPR